MKRKNINKQADNSENYRIMLNYLYKYAQNNIRCIAVSSYIEAQGKTSFVIELGERLARAGYKTLIVDCNVLSPNISKNYKKERTEGILEALEKVKNSPRGVESVELLQYVQVTSDKNLYVYLRGGYLEKPYNDYINERNIRYLFNIFKDNFMFVLIEIPSFNHLSFAQVFLSAVDGYLMMIKSGSMPIKDCEKIKNKMKIIDIEPLGAILCNEDRG